MTQANIVEPSRQSHIISLLLMGTDRKFVKMSSDMKVHTMRKQDIITS